jgi:hypothetical protein
MSWWKEASKASWSFKKGADQELDRHKIWSDFNFGRTSIFSFCVFFTSPRSKSNPSPSAAVCEAPACKATFRYLIYWSSSNNELLQLRSLGTEGSSRFKSYISNHREITQLRTFEAFFFQKEVLRWFCLLLRNFPRKNIIGYSFIE